jgi:hypothetical protein
VPFYVPVGPRGVILRVGMILTKLFGSWTYRRACSHRARVAARLDVAGSLGDA